MSEEEFGKLPPAIRFSVRRWKNEQLNQVLASLDKENSDLNKVLASLDKELSDVKKTVIAEYQKMIDNFSQLHAKKSTAPIYFIMKEDLKKVLLSGKPPELLPQLESIRSILMSPNSATPE